MKRIAMMLVTVGLTLCAAPYATADSLSDLPNADKIQAAQRSELKGDIASARENYADAASLYMRALRSDPNNAMLYNKLGISEFKMNDKGAARKYFLQALKLDSRNVPALNNLGALATVEKKYKPAVRYLKQALALDETSAPSHLNLAEAWMGLHEVDRAMTEYARALELNADILSTDRAGVIAQVTTPEQRARVSFMIAKAYAKRGNIEEALVYLRRASEGRYPYMANVYADQAFASLWPDPRLAKIVKR